jgi:hypothetical protein
MTLKTMTHREAADAALRKRPAQLPNRSAHCACVEPHARHMDDQGSRR